MCGPLTAKGCYFLLWRLKAELCSPFFILSCLGNERVPLFLCFRLCARLKRFRLLFATHPIPPQGAVGSRAPANLCAIAATAVQALEPDRLSSGNSFFHLVPSCVKNLMIFVWVLSCFVWILLAYLYLAAIALCNGQSSHRQLQYRSITTAFLCLSEKWIVMVNPASPSHRI